MKKSRKTHVIGLIFSLILILACIVTVNMGEHGRRDDTGPARYIFLFIGDGMGATHVAATESYLSYLDGEKGFRQLSFTEFPVLGMTTTYSADRNVTCSSAAGTAISCGEKTVNGRLGISPQGDTLVSIAKILRDKGYKIGILSSVPVNHATPASFYGQADMISSPVPDSSTMPGNPAMKKAAGASSKRQDTDYASAGKNSKHALPTVRKR